VYLGGAASVSVSQQATGDTTNLPQIKNCARVGRPNANTATTAINYGQIFENGNTSRYVGQVYNISFYARAGANFSSAGSALSVYVNYGTGTDQSYAGGVNSVVSISQIVTLTTTWQRFTAQVSGLSGLSTTLAAAATQIATSFNYTPVGTAGAADYFEVTGVQIDLGSTALPFRRNGGTIQGELAACQRYYWRSAESSTSNPTFTGQGFTFSTTGGVIQIPNPVQMRVKPTSIDFSSIRIYDITGAAAYTVTAVTIGDATPVLSVANVTVAGATANRVIRTDGSASSAFIGFSAEL
jgi:hypothetical protein